MSGKGHARRIDALRYAQEARSEWMAQSAHRKQRVVELYCSGQCLKKVAAQVGVASRTAERYVREYMVEHGISNRAALGAHIARQGYTS